MNVAGAVIIIVAIIRVILRNNSPESKFTKSYKEYGYKELKYRKIKKVFLLEQKGQYNKAIQQLDKIIQNGSKELAICYRHKGNIQSKISDFFEALESYEKAFNLTPNNEKLIHHMDALNYKIISKLINEGKAQQAIDFLTDILKRGEDRATTSNLNNLSWAYNTVKDFEHALEYSNYGIEKDKDDYFLLTNKGNALFGLGRNEEALVEYDKVIELAPENYSYGWYGKAVSNYHLKNYAEAEKAFRRYLEIKKTPDEDTYYYLSECLHKQRKYKEKIDFFDSLIAQNNKNPWYFNSKGDTFCFLNKFHKALECFDKVIELNENYASAYYNKCRIFCEFNILDGALDMLKKAVELNKEYIGIAENDKLLNNIKRFKQYADIVS